ncbi:receptor-type tyrosine-protein phosphatase T-like isoform X1 [Montipora capricornis]|uniref:receptor-type tyrosine-protein phosphatase T-like isoform X1 n=2 Tax=Montipora capricornis TaxID=246305 RepID=UPI0035F1B44B
MACRSIRMYFPVALLAMAVSFVSGDCIYLDLGMQRRSIPDNKITASSTLNASTPTRNGRLNYTAGSSWCASANDSNPYLQIDLQSLHIICAVSTQGNSKADEWVETYTIQTSKDGLSWTDYESTERLKTFLGNYDRHSEVKNILSGGVLARWLRFVGKAEHNKFCMRVEIFGVKRNPENLALNKPTAQSTTHNISSGPGNAVDGNRNPLFDANGNCSLTKEAEHNWWRVDLGDNPVPVTDIFIVNRLYPPSEISEVFYDIRVGNEGRGNTGCQGWCQLKNFTGTCVCYQSPLTTGTYVIIRTTLESKILSLCEVEVYSRENIAQGKLTKQIRPRSSTPSDRAVDGDTNVDTCSALDRNVRNPWWRVDLGQEELVNEVYIVTRQELSSFDIRVGPASSDNGITNPLCGSNLTVPSRGVSFFCRPSLFGQYVTIRVRSSDPVGLSLCEVEVYSARRACQMQGLGITSSLAFPSDRFSASSSRDGFQPYKARLYTDDVWSPRTDDNASDFLQIDLNGKFFICAVATQGASNDPGGYLTTSYKLLFSLNGTEWLTYKENGSDKIFEGNSNRKNIIKRNLATLTMARFIRFQPIDFENRKVLGVEVYGVPVPTGPRQAPTNLTVTALTSTSVRVSWKLPYADSIHGIKLLYKIRNSSDPLTLKTIQNNSSTTTNVTGLGKYTEYEFQVLAFQEMAFGADGNGPISPVKVIVRTNEDAPTGSPENIFSKEVDKTTFNISWAPVAREKRNGKITVYEIRRKKTSNGARSRRSLDEISRINLTETFFVWSGFQLGCTYNVSVRAFTSAGSGPLSKEKSLQSSDPKPPYLKVQNIGKTELELTWNNPLFSPEEVSEYSVTYYGTKDYIQDFSDSGTIQLLQQTVKTLVPYTSYKFHFSGKSACGQNVSQTMVAKTKVAAPLEPDVKRIRDESVDNTSVMIELWPAIQTNGPISSYQIIVLEVIDGNEDLPDDYSQKLDNSNEEQMGFYIAAEIKNIPLLTESWEFYVGNEETYGGYENKKLQRGHNYLVYQRAVTSVENVILKGKVSKVAKISVKKSKGTESQNPRNESQQDKIPVAAIAVPVVLIILFAVIAVAGVVLYRKRKQKTSSKGSDRVLDDIGSSPSNSTATTDTFAYENPANFKRTSEKYRNDKPPKEIYQNANVCAPGESDDQVYQNISRKRKGQRQSRVEDTSPEMDPLYDEAEDSKPKAIPVAQFSEFVKNKSKNGAVVLNEEFKKLIGGMLSPWKVAQENKAKNRYGNIVTYDHSRVVLDEVEGRPGSDYINATYIPSYDEETMAYIATQGPTSVTAKDFWRMIWQENSSVIVMLTNLVEHGKSKCDQYWPNSASKYDDINVSLHKTENFANYVIRTFHLVKGSQKREVYQFHYTTWPDRGVPHNSTALLTFRWKVYAQQQLTEGPVVVHCSAGVGRTGTYIGIDAMLESAKDRGNVCIKNYVEAMRRQRPYMVQKEEQYVFLHQAVMVALACGNTEVSPQDLMIRINKLSRVSKSTKQTGYEEEFQRLQRISETESQEVSTIALKSTNVDKNRSSNNVPGDTYRVILRSSQPDRDYINASFVDGNVQRDAYILTQAPLNNTIEDFWRMVSQYDAGTVVMLNNLKEENQKYPQYWPSEGHVRYGDVTLKILEKKTSQKITIRRISVLNAEPPKKTSTVQHLQFDGWSDPNLSPDPKEILQLVSAIEKSQQKTGNGVIVLQCSDGVGRSATLAAIMSVIEKIKTEQTIDVFQTIKLIRVKRHGAVTTSEQYRFCYKTTAAYLDSFKTYSNFADC